MDSEEHEPNSPEGVIAKNLLSLRGDWSQREMANKIGLTRQGTLWRYEQGRVPNSVALKMIASRLGLTPESLLTPLSEEQIVQARNRLKSAAGKSLPPDDASRLARHVWLEDVLSWRPEPEAIGDDSIEVKVAYKNLLPGPGRPYRVVLHSPPTLEVAEIMRRAGEAGRPPVGIALLSLCLGENHDAKFLNELGFLDLLRLEHAAFLLAFGDHGTALFRHWEPVFRNLEAGPM